MVPHMNAKLAAALGLVLGVTLIGGMWLGVEVLADDAGPSASGGSNVGTDAAPAEAVVDTEALKSLCVEFGRERGAGLADVSSLLVAPNDEEPPAEYKVTGQTQPANGGVMAFDCWVGSESGVVLFKTPFGEARP